MKENMEAVKQFNSNSIYHGYLCSSHDPFLSLICVLFGVNIHHNFCGTWIKMEVDETDLVPKGTIKLISTPGHMRYGGYQVRYL
jgi:hypothetical protein